MFGTIKVWGLRYFAFFSFRSIMKHQDVSIVFIAYVSTTESIPKSNMLINSYWLCYWFFIEPWAVLLRPHLFFLWTFFRSMWSELCIRLLNSRSLWYNVQVRIHTGSGQSRVFRYVSKSIFYWRNIDSTLSDWVYSHYDPIEKNVLGYRMHLVYIVWQT